ncbi:MAG: 3-hydroxyacyl-[acyl-carrier-protein] dehydratase FabZ, partial [Actinomycetota bacterium]|nr:3-hydroxyacyl-[acyl-carrier-protein] dehydratase FabZ [Actinomycetota bacterium]
HFFKGHFPGRPTLPGVLMCESIAQLGAYVVLQDSRFKDKLPLFGGLENARFRQQVLPGDTLKLQVEVLRLSARGGKAFGEAYVNENLACSAELMFIAVEK